MLPPGSRGFVDNTVNTVCMILEVSGRPGITVPCRSRVGSRKSVDLGTELEVRQPTQEVPGSHYR